MIEQPVIWVLKGLRAGDTAQAVELALRLGGHVEGKSLSFNVSHVVPNWLLGTRVSHLTPESRALLHPPWPDLVVATGKRAAPVARWIKQQSDGHSKLVLLGRPRMALKHFDLVVTTPQYGLPALPNVMDIKLPFAHPKPVVAADMEAFTREWSDLPRPWILGVIGGAKYPLRLQNRDIAAFGTILGTHAAQVGGSVILLDSPRSPDGAVDIAARHVASPKWLCRRGQSVNPYQAALALCDELVVTSDSVSMVSEMLLTGKPTSIYRLPVSKLLPRWSAHAGFGAVLAKAGVLHPPRNVDGFMTGLIDAGYLGDISTVSSPKASVAINTSHQAVIDRIKNFIKDV